MKTIEELHPNYGPVYVAALYPTLACFFQKRGYALAVHGSLARDFDLIAVPWVETPIHHAQVVSDLETRFGFMNLSPPAHRPFGRRSYSIAIGFGECALDLSFFPDRGT